MFLCEIGLIYAWITIFVLGLYKSFIFLVDYICIKCYPHIHSYD